MKTFLSNILLTFCWMVVTGLFEPSNFLFGFLLSYGILRLFLGIEKSESYFSKLNQAIGFILFFLLELFKANLRVAHDVLTPRHRMKPGVIDVPLDVETDAEITLLANLITLTPGTLSLDISTDRKVLYIHSMYIDDVEEFRRDIKDGFERRVKELLR
jgi:multicomponent Na+:H+ antiporter subunit E